MKYFYLMLFIAIGLTFYLFHYTIFPVKEDYILSGRAFVFLQAAWFSLCFILLYIVARLCQLTHKEKGLGIGLLAVLGLLCHLVDLPDKIDFWRAKNYLEKTNLEYLKGNPNGVFIEIYYETNYPLHVPLPLIADSRRYVLGTPSEIAAMKKRWKGYHFIQVDKAGWYILYEENIFDPDAA